MLHIRGESLTETGKRRQSVDVGEAAWVVDESPDATNDLPPREGEQPHEQSQNSEADSTTSLRNELPLSLLGEESEEADKPSTLDIKRLIIGVWRRKWIVIAIAFIIAALALAVAIFGVNKTWTARSVLIKKEKLDQFSVGNGLNPYRPQEYSFETMLGTLKLPTVLDRALARSGVETLSRIFASQVRVSRNKDSNLFEIFVEWDTPELAATLTNNLVSVFIDYNLSMRSDEAKAAYAYFNKKLSEVDANARSVDQKIQAFRKEKNIIDIQKQGEAWIQNINTLELEQRAMAAEVQEMQKTREKLVKLLEAEPEMTIATTLYRNPLKIKKASLELSLEEIRGRYTDANPKVLELLDQIASVDRLIAEGGDAETPENTYRPNPLRESMRLKLLEHEDQLSIKAALHESLTASLSDARAKLKDFTDTREKFNALVDERASMSALLDDLRNRVEEVSVVMQGTQSDFEVIEPAVPPSESNPTTKRLIAIAGVVLGGGTGLFVALLLEFFDTRLRTRKEVMGLTGVDTVFEIHQIQSLEQLSCRLDNPDSEGALLVRRILNELESSGNSKLPSLVPISGIGRGAGRTTIVESFATVSAQKGVSTLAVDSDLGSHNGARAFGFDDAKLGLADYLSQRCDSKQILYSTASRFLKVIPAGTAGSLGRTAMLRLSSNIMTRLVRRLELSQYRVLIDLPPVDEYEQVFELLQHIGSVVLVVRSGVTDKSRLKAMSDRFERAGIQILAVVLTDVPPIYAEQPLQFASKG